MRVRRLLVEIGLLGSLVAGPAAAVAVGVGAGEAQATVPLGISLVKVTPSEATIKVVCPVDPPTTLFVSSDQGLVASQPITCDRTRQRFTIPVTLPGGLVRGQVLTGVQATASGDSGEVNAFYSSVVVR